MKAAIGTIFLGLSSLFFPGCSKPNPLSVEAYVWQQVHTEAVDQAVTRAGPILDGFSLHAADVTFRGPDAKVTRFDLPWRASTSELPIIFTVQARLNFAVVQVSLDG